MDRYGLLWISQWFQGLSMISQQSFSDRYGRQGLHQILNQVKTVSAWSPREAVFQWTLSDLSTIFQWSPQSFKDLSVIFQ